MSQRKRIFVISPLKAAEGRTVEDHLRLLEVLCREVVGHGHAPWAPHGFYTHFLDDSNAYEREMGIECGLAWLEVCDEVWVYEKLGISSGMAAEIAMARRFGRPVYTPPTWARVNR